MSDLAEQLRKATLKQKADDAVREAQELAASFHVAWGMGGEPSQKAIDRYNAACARAETLLLEYAAAC